MESSRSLLVLFSVSLVVIVKSSDLLTPSQDIPSVLVLRPDLQARSDALCKELVKEPYFELELVIGEPWRVFYVWNMKVDSKICINIQFKIATPMKIRQFYYDMNEYLMEQPAWGAASLLLRMGRSLRELLLFDDQGPAGKFVVVPNVLRDARMPPIKHEVPLMKFQMKLTENGKYLIIMDCQIGAASIAARYEQPPNREEINQVAEKYASSFGPGYPACGFDRSNRTQ